MKFFILVGIAVGLSGCASIKMDHKSQTVESKTQSEQSEQDMKELEALLQEDQKSLGIKQDESVPPQSEVDLSANLDVKNPLPVDPRNLDLIRFNIACWNLDNEGEVIYEENAQLQAVSDVVILITDKDDKHKSLPALCLMEANEKFTDVPFSPSSVNFECLFDGNVIEGSRFHYVSQLSSSILWLIDPTNGQNFILSTKLCQLSKSPQ